MVGDLADVDRIDQQSMQGGNPTLCSPTAGFDRLKCSNKPLALKIQIEYLTDSLCFQFVDDQLLGRPIDVVTQTLNKVP